MSRAETQITLIDTKRKGNVSDDVGEVVPTGSERAWVRLGAIDPILVSEDWFLANCNVFDFIHFVSFVFPGSLIFCCRNG